MELSRSLYFEEVQRPKILVKIFVENKNIRHIYKNMAGKKPSKQGAGRTGNKQKNARRQFTTKTAKYKNDSTDTVCNSFVDTVAALAHTDSAGTQYNFGALANTATVIVGNNDIVVKTPANRK